MTLCYDQLMLYAREFGHHNLSKPSLIILHGLFGSSKNWQTIANHLGQQHHVIVPDLRNHGNSYHTDNMDYLAMAHDVFDLITHNQLDNVVVIGHSMGGKVAMIMALQETEKISALMILDIAPTQYNHNFSSLFSAMRSLDLEHLNNRREADHQLQPHITELGLRQFILQNLSHENGHFKWRINIDILEKDIHKILDFPIITNTYHKPTFFLGGMNSDYIQEQHHAIIYQFFPQAKIDMIANAGHWLHIEQTDHIISKLDGMLNATV